MSESASPAAPIPTTPAAPISASPAARISASPAARISATPAAREAVIRLSAARGAPVMFVQSGGCCAGSTPMCYPSGEFLVGDIDVLLGDIEGSRFYIDKRLDQAWHQDQFLLDVADGEPEGFSLAAGANQHFVTLSPVCPAPGTRE